MAIRRAAALTVLTLGLVLPVVGCSSPAPVAAPIAVETQASSTGNDAAANIFDPKVEQQEQQEIKAAARESVRAQAEAEKQQQVEAAAKAEVERVAAEQAATEAAAVAAEPEPVIAPAPIQAVAPAPVAAATPAQVPVAAAPAVAAPAPAQAVLPVQAAPQAEQAVASRTIYVGLSGFQDVVDRGAGPVLWPLPGFPPYVAEHDGAGGWARFGSLQPGMKVTMTGLVGGTYTVGKIINVPKGGSTSELYAFGNMPKVMLQTCVPGTSRMIVVGLY